MNPARTAKLLSSYSSGVITAAEVANAMLTDLMSDADVGTGLRSVVAELPDEVREELLDLLRNIRRANYHWKPFLIGIAKTPDADPTMLQRICAELGVV